MPSKRRKQQHARKVQKKRAMARKHGEKQTGRGNSNYGRKADFLFRNGGHGFDWPTKPWKRS